MRLDGALLCGCGELGGARGVRGARLGLVEARFRVAHSLREGRGVSD